MEKEKKAFLRLQEEILKQTEDESLLVYQSHSFEFGSRSLLAAHQISSRHRLMSFCTRVTNDFETYMRVLILPPSL